MVVKRHHFKKSILASLVSSISLTGVSAYAQDQENDEVVVVTGIRASLIQSMDLKRDSDGVVDAISSEDIGKFPDTNLAESLQRITGVSIDRNNGEGEFVTVRGFGPDYNMVTLNGRTMPTSSIQNTDAADSRAFSFANIASEGVSAVKVYKTGRADVASGGVGGTIDLVTIKPLEAGGTKFSVGVKAVNDTSSEVNDRLTPEVTGLFSTTFADDTMGIALSGSYQNRKYGNARAEVENGWRPGVSPNAAWGGPLGPAAPDDGPDPHVNRPAEGTLNQVPQNVVYGIAELERTRINGQATFQWSPVESVTATLDYTYAENDIEQNQNISSFWNNFGFTGGVWSGAEATGGALDGGVVTPLSLTENNTGVAGGDGLGGITEGDLTFADYVSQVEKSGQATELSSTGLNIEWAVTDSLDLFFDYHQSQSITAPNTDLGNSNTIQLAANVRAQTTFDFSDDLPVVSTLLPADIDYTTVDGATGNPWGDVASLGDAADRARTTGTSFRNSLTDQTVDEWRLGGSYNFDDSVLESIDFGVGWRETNNRNAFAEAQRPNWGGTGTFDDVPTQLLQDSLSSFSDRFDAVSGDADLIADEYFALPFDEIADIIGGLYYNDVAGAWPCFERLCAPSIFTTDQRTTEEVTSAYLQATFAMDISSDLSARATIGVRNEETTVESSTLLPEPTEIAWVSVNEFAITRGDAVFFEGEGDYSHTLPNADISLTFLEDMVLRLSYSETIGRPTFGDLTAGGRLDEVRFDTARGSRGNPGLLPLESTNIDVSFEYYYAEGSYASIGYFSKDVDNFVADSFATDSPFTVVSPVEGSRIDDAIAAAGAGATVEQIRDQLVADNPTDPTITPGDTGAGIQPRIAGNPETDDPVTVLFSQPGNRDNNSLDGIEIAVQHLFGESGFGVIANYTMVDSDLEADPTDLAGDAQVPLEGLSDTINIVAFYDNHGLQARIAYNWRDEFFTNNEDAIGPAAVFTDEYSQIDFNVSYDINDNFSVLFEGINITDEYTRLYNRHSQATDTVVATGPRYAIGARYKF